MRKIGNKVVKTREDRAKIRYFRVEVEEVEEIEEVEEEDVDFIESAEDIEVETDDIKV